MPVKLNSSGGGSVTLTTPSTASDYTVTVPAVTGSALVSTSGASTSSTGIDFPSANTVAIKTNGTTAVTVDSSQNVGIGVTPSTWSLGKAIEINTVGNSVWATSTAYVMGNNFYYNGGYKFAGTGYATSYIQSTGAHVWNVSTASGTAGNAITFTQAVTLDSSGNLLVTGGGGLGYGTGSGGTVTQATSKTTGVTLNKTVGQITTAADALGAGATAAFTVTNSTFAAVDCVVLNSQNINYSVRISDNAAGSFKITIKNESAGSLSQAVVINFAVIKGATS